MADSFEDCDCLCGVRSRMYIGRCLQSAVPIFKISRNFCITNQDNNLAIFRHILWGLRFKVVTDVNMNDTVLWSVTPWSLRDIYQCLEENRHLLPQFLSDSTLSRNSRQFYSSNTIVYTKVRTAFFFLEGGILFMEEKHLCRWERETINSGLLYEDSLTLILLTWKIWWAPKNTSKWQMRFNSGFKGLTL